MKTVTAIKEGSTWITAPFLITGDIYLIIQLSKKGTATIRSAESAGGTLRNQYVSPVAGPKFEFRIYGQTSNVYLQIVTDNEPLVIKYAYI